MALDRIREEKKKHKKTKKNLEKSELKKDHITYLKKRIEDLKRNEENLLQDLVQQQTISKDALQGLDSLRVKFDEEKRLMKEEMDHYYVILLDQEKEKYQNLLSRHRKLESTENEFKELKAQYDLLKEKNNDQRNTMHDLQRMLEDSRKENQHLEQNLDNKTRELDQKEKEFKQVVGELRNELEELGTHLP